MEGRRPHFCVAWGAWGSDAQNRRLLPLQGARECQLGGSRTQRLVLELITLREDARSPGMGPHGLRLEGRRGTLSLGLLGVVVFFMAGACGTFFQSNLEMQLNFLLWKL